MRSAADPQPENDPGGLPWPLMRFPSQAGNPLHPGRSKGRKSPVSFASASRPHCRPSSAAVLFSHGGIRTIGGFAGQGTICGSKSVHARHVVVLRFFFWALVMWINMWNSGGYSQTHPDGGRELPGDPRGFGGNKLPVQNGQSGDLYFSEMERARNANAERQQLSVIQGLPGRPRAVAHPFSFSREIHRREIRKRS